MSAASDHVGTVLHYLNLNSVLVLDFPKTIADRLGPAPPHCEPV